MSLATKSRFKCGDILFGKLRPYFRKVVRAPDDGLCSTDIWVVRAKDKIDQGFLYYCMASQQFVDFATSGSEGTKMPRAIWQYASRYEIPFPSFSEQRSIAHVLGILDDKIELNRRMNETLEAMARALFKSWFVDFDPVRAKIALKHHKSITPPLRGSRQGKGPSPQASRWGEIKRLYSPQTLERAKALRQSQSNAEGLLWHYLRKKQLDGHKFRRQQPIGRYIVDFVCMPKKLVIELDGGQHSTQKAYDEQRDKFLRERGYRVLRFWNSKVFENCYGVLESILAALQDDATKVSENPPSPSSHHSSQTPQTYHSPLEGESERQGPQPAADPVGGRQSKGASPKLSRSPVSNPSRGESDWTVKRAKAYLDKLPPDVANLFPDRLVDSELGEIPEGWEVGVLDDSIKLLSGGTPKTSISDYWGGDIPWYTPKDAPNLGDVFVLETERNITQEGVENSATKILPSRTTIITARGTVGRLACLGRPMAMNQTCYGIQGAKGYSDFFTYWSIKKVVDELQNRTHGTVFDTITRQTFKFVDMVFPSVNVAEAFECTVNPIMARILNNLQESRAITAQRDALLPKLVSGDLRVGNYG